MPNPLQLTHLLDVAGDRLCCAEDGPAVDAFALLDAACAAGVVFCPSCARVFLTSIMKLAQSRCAADPLLGIIHVLTKTPPEMVDAVMLIFAPALVELDDHVERIRGAP